MAYGQTTLDGGVAIDADKEIAISIYAKGGNRADAVGYWQGPSATLRGTTSNGPIFIPTGANRRVQVRVNNTTDNHFQMAVQSGQASMGGLFSVRVQERGPEGETGPAGDTGSRGSQGSQGDQGDQGNQGVQGNTGARGAQGTRGVQGIQGEQGDAGDSGTLDINGLSALSGSIANGDDLVIYDDSAGANRKVSMPGIGAYTSRLSGFITTSATPANSDYFYFADGSDSNNMKRVTGTNLKTYIGAGGDSDQVAENVLVLEHILDRLADFDQRVSDIDQTSVEDTLANVTGVNMRTTTNEPTDSDRTSGNFFAALAGLTIGPTQTGYLLFRIGIDEQPNLYEPRLFDSNNLIIQNLRSLGFATELSETAGHRYFYIPRYFPLEDTGTLRLRKTTRTAHHDWLGTVHGDDLSHEVLTQAAYDAITTKDDATVYLVTA